jgi:hypothetical protein
MLYIPNGALRSRLFEIRDNSFLNTNGEKEMHILLSTVQSSKILPC